MSIWKDIKANNFDEADQCYTIDAWKTKNQDEEGKVIAKVYVNESKKVIYIDEKAKTDKYAQEVINKIQQR